MGPPVTFNMSTVPLKGELGMKPTVPVITPHPTRKSGLHATEAFVGRGLGIPLGAVETAGSLTRECALSPLFAPDVQEIVRMLGGVGP